MNSTIFYSPAYETAANTASRIGPGLVILLLFAFFRPLTTAIHQIGSINILDAFGLASSYLMLMVLFPSIKRLELSAINILVFLYILYCILSLAWGSDLREMSRILLPFIPFFLAQIVIQSDKHLRLVLSLMILGYVVPIIGSATTIFLGISFFEVDYYSGIARHYGLATGAHALAHMMLFFSYVLGLQFIVNQNSRPSLMIGLAGLFLGSLYCIFMTNTRTVYLGVFIFWSFFLWSWKKKIFVSVFLSLLVVFVLYSGQVKKVLTRSDPGKAETQSMNYISSGRFSLWDHNIRIFENLPVWQQMLGVGFGNEQKSVVDASARERVVSSSHNDYLSLLMVSGIIGLILYGLIQMTFLINIINSGITKRLKYCFIGVLCTVVALNFVSNSYVNRFPLAQLFWFYAGIFYALAKVDRLRSPDMGFV